MEIVRDPEGKEIEYLENMGKLAGQRVIEIGAGEGRMTWRYAPMADSVVAIDPDHERIIEAVRTCPEKLSPKVHFARAKSQRLPFRDENFDVAVFAWSL